MIWPFFSFLFWSPPTHTHARARSHTRTNYALYKNCSVIFDFIYVCALVLFGCRILLMFLMAKKIQQLEICITWYQTSTVMINIPSLLLGSSQSVMVLSAPLVKVVRLYSLIRSHLLLCPSRFSIISMSFDAVYYMQLKHSVEKVKENKQDIGKVWNY
jgi:hypothetical protein